MADPAITAQFRADAMVLLAANAPALATALGIDPPKPVAPEALKEPLLREARTLESLADFIGRASVAAAELNKRTEAAAGSPRVDLTPLVEATRTDPKRTKGR